MIFKLEILLEVAKDSVSSAADNIQRQAADVRQSAEHVVENSSTSTFIASSLVLAVAFFNSINL